MLIIVGEKNGFDNEKSRGGAFWVCLLASTDIGLGKRTEKLARLEIRKAATYQLVDNSTLRANGTAAS